MKWAMVRAAEIKSALSLDGTDLPPADEEES